MARGGSSLIFRILGWVVFVVALAVVAFFAGFYLAEPVFEPLINRFFG